MNLGADMVRDKPQDAFAIPGDRRSPVSKSPPANRSIQSRPSGLSITSTTDGSSSQSAIAGPSAVRSMRAPRDVAS